MLTKALPAVLLFLLLCHLSQAQQTGNTWDKPIWKSAPIPENKQAELQSYDPYGLHVGVKIKTDCSIRVFWREKLYCFNSLTSKAYFLDRSDWYIKSTSAFLKQQ